MSQKEFDEVLDKWANPRLFKKTNGRWEPKFEVGKEFEMNKINNILIVG